MNYRVERVRNRPGRLREIGDRLTGGGLRNLSRRMATTWLRIAMSQPFLKALVRSVLQPFPSLSARVDQLTTAPDTMAANADPATTTSTNLPRHRDHSLLVNSLYKTAFGRMIDPDGLTHCSRQLQQGASFEMLAEQIVTSAEFLTRHGSDRAVDMKYLTALYLDGLGRPPNIEDLAFWLAEAESDVTRAKVLAAVAGSDEALEKLSVQAPDSEAIYQRWVAGCDTIGGLDRRMIRTHIAGLPFCPLISVIVLLDRTAAVAFRESLNSVITQLYPYWELCLTIDELTEPLLSRILSESEDPRIKVNELNGSESVTAATNAALSLATGDFVTVLRSGDILPEHALYEVAFELGRNERTDIVYTDNDQIGPDGKRSHPWFKPGWDPDLLLAQDYISHLAVYRAPLLTRSDFCGQSLKALSFMIWLCVPPPRQLRIASGIFLQSSITNAMRIR